MELLSFLYPTIEIAFLSLTIYFAVIKWQFLFIFLGLLFLYPFVLEPLLFLFYTAVYKLRNGKRRHDELHARFAGKNHLVYDPVYNLRVLGIEKQHSFDALKYEKVLHFLNERQPTWGFQNYNHCGDPDYPFLYTHVGFFHILLMNYSLYLSKIVEIMVCFVPSIILRVLAVRRFLHTTQGTITASCLAVEKGWAINVGGGYHHASKHQGCGFCPFNDIGLAIEHLWEHHQKIKRILIIDLDAHQGNGHERDKLRLQQEGKAGSSQSQLENDHNHPTAAPSRLIERQIYIADMYNHHIYPGDGEAKKGIDLEVRLQTGESDKTYIPKLEKLLKDVSENFVPDFIIYNAGTDIMMGDPLGRMNITPGGIAKRDEMVFDFAIRSQIPILMVLSGGYQKSNAEAIANSIINMMEKHILGK